MVSGLKYIGKGGFVSGVPARDLTPDEVEKLGIKVYFWQRGFMRK